MYQNRPQIGKLHYSTNEVKSTCVNVSVNHNISVEISRAAVQTVTKSLYGCKFYLTREEAIDKYPRVSLYKEKQLPVHLNDKKKKKQPVPTSQEQICSRLNSICLYQ